MSLRRDCPINFFHVTTNRIDTLFFELLQVAIGTRNELSSAPSAEEWQLLYQLCRKHTLVGIGFCGMRLLPEYQSPSVKQVIHWTAQADAIRQDNVRMNNDCDLLCRKLDADGMEGRIIKGQSNYFFYPEVTVSSSEEGEEGFEKEPLGMYRTSGDIDVLVRPMDHRHCVSQVIRYCQREAAKHSGAKFHTYYHDSELLWKSGTEVEAHHRAIWLNAPWRNAVLQRWLRSEPQWKRTEKQIDDARFYVATTDFNVVYHLLHVYKHLFEEGIGLRQLMDYYMVLRAWTQEHSQDVAQARKEQMRLLHRFDCDRFAAAAMYVLQQVFALPDELLLCPPDVKRGEFLLTEILRAGNFGHYDDRLEGHREYETLWHAWDKLKRNMKYVTQYPEEVLGEPIFSIYHWCWRKFRLWRF